MVAGPPPVSLRSHQLSYAPPSYGRTSFLLSSRFDAAEEMLTANLAQQAEASPPEEEEDEEVEEEEEEVEDKEGEEEGEEEEGQWGLGVC